MARYIDADKLIEHLVNEKEQCPNDEIEYPISYGCRLGLQGAISFAETLSTADVVPKSEVAEWIAEAIHYQNLWCQTEIELDQAKQEVAREIFEEIETALCRSVYPRINANGTITTISSKDWHIRCDDYNAIKKKYTESEGNDSLNNTKN